MILSLFLLASGCRERDIRTGYGSRSGYNAKSVNGTSVLGQMFKDAGHRVRSWRLLSPSLKKADVIVWFPQDHQPPPFEVVAWFDEWLQYSYDEDTWEYQDKILILVGRTYDAEELYWRQTQALAPAKLKAEFARRLRRAKTKALTGAAAKAGDADGWCELTLPGKRKPVTTLAGPWAAGVDASKATIEHHTAVAPDHWMAPLLTDGAGHPLVSQGVYEQEEEDWGADDSRLLLVENGSFLLNASLVNHENRKLAGRLVEYVGDPAKDVVFLESSASPTISETDPRMGPPTGLELFRVWPIGGVLAQAAALGLVFALAQFPIFGVPRRLQQPSLTDFGRHVKALSRLLAATRDRAYARGLLSKYFSEVNQE